MKRSRTFIRLIALTILINATACGQRNSKTHSTYNKSLATQLDSILTEDQKYRQQFVLIENQYGIKSKEKTDLINTIKKQDSINIIKIISFLEKYGWLGKDEVGENGNLCLFLVIQHANLQTQEKYLPMMKAAVKKGKASGSNLAFLEDRIALRQGKKQIYGTQLYRDDGGSYYFAPIEDEKNVNKRRKEVGLGTIEERAKEFGFNYTFQQKEQDASQMNTIEAEATMGIKP